VNGNSRPFFIEAACSLFFHPVFLLAPAFFFPYTLPIKKKLLIKKIRYEGEFINNA
jgi:hypothetical protein